MYKKIVIVIILLLLLASGCLSNDTSQAEAAKESVAGNEEMGSTSANSFSDDLYEDESVETIEEEQVSTEKQIVVPPHTATEIVFQGKYDGDYLLLNTTEHTYFVNQTGTENDFAGDYKETSQTYNLNGAFGATDIFFKGENCVYYETEDGDKVYWYRV